MSRADRVAEQIKQEVSDIILRKLRDPRIGFTSVVKVDIGTDLDNACIYVSVLGTEKEKEDTMTALEHAAKYVRGELGKRLQLREVPEVVFKLDESIERASKFFAVLNVVKRQEQGETIKPSQIKKRTKELTVDKKARGRSREKDIKRNKKSR
jgi:ribosome-binding factor A